MSLLLILMACVAPAVALADAKPFCFLQKVDVTQVANATVITLEADGIIELSSEGLNMWQERITFTLKNVRGGAAPMVQVARYPVSHVEFALPPGQRDNIGLRCTLVLYKQAVVTVFGGGEGDNWDYARWRPGGPVVMISPSQNRDKILITIVSDRPEEPEPKRPEVKPAPSRLEVTGDAEALTLQALHADPTEVIEQLGERAGAVIMMDDPVTDPITAHLENMPLARLLTALASANGLCLSEIDGAYHLSLSSADTATAYGVGETRALTLDYLSVQEALLLLPDVALPYVRRLDAGNQLVVSGPRSIVSRIAEDIAALDKPAYQCRVRAWVITSQKDQTSLRELLAGFSGGTTGVGFDSDGNLSVDIGSPRASEFMVNLRALASEGRLQMQALPSIWCRSGQTASLFVGQKVYYWRYRYYWSEEQTLDAADVGTQLVFRPRTDGQSIIARVTLTSDSLGLQNPAGPLVMRRTARSTVQLQSGQFMLIGGLTQTDTLHRRDRPSALPPPVDAIASGQLRVRTEDEVALLLQADAALSPPVTTMPADAKTDGS